MTSIPKDTSIKAMVEFWKSCTKDDLVASVEDDSVADAMSNTYNPNYSSEREGIHLRSATIVSCYKEGKYHNDSGPSCVIFSKKDGAIIYKSYHLNGQVLTSDQLLYKLIESKELADKNYIEAHNATRRPR